MLIDSYALEQAVATSDLPGQMLQGLDKVGVRGLGVLGDGLRRPIAVKHPLLGVADWRGITSGARFADASQAALASLRNAFAPVYASLEQDSQTTAFIQQIRALKQSTPAGASLAIPAGCTGKALEQPAGNTGTAPADLNGTYRYVLTKEDARKAGDPELDAFPQVTTVKLQDGRVAGGCFGQGATYSVSGDRITFNSPESGYSTTFTFSADGEGNLHLTPVPPMDKGDAFQCSYKAWTKIG
jgi:hypothetical protein